MNSVRVGIVDYGMGNIGSLVNIMRFLAIDVSVINQASALKDFENIIIPGVGHFANAMAALNKLGFIGELEVARSASKNILGICLGMQLFTEKSEEGAGNGLGWFKAETKRFSGVRADGAKYPVPHMGWSRVEIESQDSNLFEHNDRFYFVHSFYVKAIDPRDVLLSCSYNDVSFAAALRHENVTALQFHPEKSHSFGLRFFKKYYDLEK